ncbi:MAG: ketopantoate reductase family protein [Promethearchaeota archaeon]|nr:MAG: ketopantoate reductase family protein [Candidatus Lokiarchaeota archaeon]
MACKKKIRIGIIGAGSIGSLFGGYLAYYKTEDFDQEIIFFSRKSHCDAINERGLIIQNKKNTLHISGIKAYENLSKFYEKLGGAYEFNFDYIIISTKSIDLENALKEYKEIIEKSTCIVILQNGIGNEELVAKYYKKEKIIRIITSHGALLKEPGKILHTGDGFVEIGFPFKNGSKSKLEFLCSFLSLGGLKTNVVENIEELIWEKAFVNIAINPLGALTRLDNGELIKNTNILKIMELLIEESVSVSQRLGIKLPNKNYFKLAKDVAYRTKENKNSMLQDILRSNPTEIDYLNGKIVEIASTLGLATPINKFITTLIKGLEKSYL